MRSNIQHPHRSVDVKRTRFASALFVGIGAIALLGACSSDGSPLDGLGPGDEVEAPEPEAPEPEPEVPEPEPEPEVPEPEVPEPEVPEPEPEPETPEPDPEPEVPAVDEPVDDLPEEDGDSAQGWIIFALLGAAALAIIVGIVSLAAGRSNKNKAALAAQQRRVGELVGLGRWIHDQGSVEVLRATDANQLQASWQTVRARSVDLETRSTALAATTDDSETRDMLLRLATDVAGLRGSLETNVSLRLGPDAAAQIALVNDSTGVVSQRRQDVDVDLTRLSAMRG